VTASSGRPLKIYAIEDDGAIRPLEEGAEVRERTFHAGLREAEILVLTDPAAVSTKNESERQDLETALLSIPTLHLIDANTDAAHLEWLVSHLSPFDRVSAPDAVKALPKAARLNHKVDTAEAAVTAMAAVSARPMIDDPCLARSSNPIVRAMAEPGLSLAERKSKFFDCQEALSAAVASTLTSDKIIGMESQVVELGAGLAFAPTASAQVPVLHSIEAHSGIAALALDFDHSTSLHDPDTLDPAALANCSMVIVNGWMPEVVAARPLRSLIASQVRVIFLEQFDFLDQFDSAPQNRYQNYLITVLDHMAQLFPGCGCHLRRLRLLGHKPNDFSPQTALVELEVRM